jgi:hypothetical protein
MVKRNFAMATPPKPIPDPSPLPQPLPPDPGPDPGPVPTRKGPSTDRGGGAKPVQSE